MPLIIRYDPALGGYKPQVLCDECGGVIETADVGNYQWVMGPNPDGTEEGDSLVYYTHKRCCHPFETRRPLPEGATWGAEMLGFLPVFLGNNLKVDWEKLRPFAPLMVPAKARRVKRQAARESRQ